MSPAFWKRRLHTDNVSAITGFPPGVATAIEIGTAAATAANADYVTAYAQGQALTPTVDEAGLATLAGLTLVPGVYEFDAAVTLSGILTLSGSGTYVFKVRTRNISRLSLTSTPFQHR